MALALLIDVKRCIGCRGCVAACKEAHALPPGDADTELSASALTAMRDVAYAAPAFNAGAAVERGAPAPRPPEPGTQALPTEPLHAERGAPAPRPPEPGTQALPTEPLHVRSLCLHCLDPSCTSVCPVGALRRTPEGPVLYDAARCLGCRYCMLACPFGVPRYEWHSATPAVRKCDLCAARRARGQAPACVEICPAEATQWGQRDELLAEARRRIAADPQGYVPRIYGEREVGGTSVLFLSPVPFETLGLRTLGERPLPELTWVALEKVPGVVTIGGALLSAVWWITHRREEVAQAEKAQAGKESLS